MVKRNEYPVDIDGQETPHSVLIFVICDQSLIEMVEVRHL